MQPRLEVADVFRNGAAEFLRQYGRHHSANHVGSKKSADTWTL